MHKPLPKTPHQKNPPPKKKKEKRGINTPSTKPNAGSIHPLTHRHLPEGERKRGREQRMNDVPL